MLLYLCDKGWIILCWIFPPHVIDLPFPKEIKALLKWKVCSLTPNIVKNCCARAGFSRCTSMFSITMGYITGYKYWPTFWDMQLAIVAFHIPLDDFSLIALMIKTFGNKLSSLRWHATRHVSLKFFIATYCIEIVQERKYTSMLAPCRLQLNVGAEKGAWYPPLVHASESYKMSALFRFKSQCKFSP